MLTVGVYGATGQVGTVMRSAARGPPLSRTTGCGSSPAPAPPGRHLDGVVVEDVATADHRGVDIALFSMGAAASREFGEKVAAAGAIVIDNSSGLAHGPRLPPRGAGSQRRRAWIASRRGSSPIPTARPWCACRCWPPCTPRPGWCAWWRRPTRPSRAPAWPGRPNWKSRCGAVADKAAALTLDGAALEFPPAVGVPGADRLQRPAARRHLRRRRDRRGAQVPQREPQDPGHPRAGGVGDLRAGARLHRPFAGPQRHLRPAPSRPNGPWTAAGRAGRRGGRCAHPAASRPEATPAWWVGCGATTATPLAAACPCSCPETTCARAQPSTPCRSPRPCSNAA